MVREFSFVTSLAVPALSRHGDARTVSDDQNLPARLVPSLARFLLAFLSNDLSCRSLGSVGKMFSRGRLEGELPCHSKTGNSCWPPLVTRL
jgi:hypothetical protein